jgi:4-hydroxy-2-oxoheptanedioate aldolase
MELASEETFGPVAAIFLLVQAETVTAMHNLAAICAVDGVDGVFIGPADLAASMGHRGKPGHPDVQAAIEGAIKTIVASGKAAGTLTSDPALARRYLALGATFVAVGVDVMLFVNAVRKLSNDFLGDGKATAPAAPGAAY